MAHHGEYRQAAGILEADSAEPVPMSAFGGKADIGSGWVNVCF
jgi:hypothetical protein